MTRGLGLTLNGSTSPARRHWHTSGCLSLSVLAARGTVRCDSAHGLARTVSAPDGCSKGSSLVSSSAKPPIMPTPAAGSLPVSDQAPSDHDYPARDCPRNGPGPPSHGGAWPGLPGLTCKRPQQLPLATSGLLPLAAEPVAGFVQAAACQAEHQDRPADTGARAHHRLKQAPGRGHRRRAATVPSPPVPTGKPGPLALDSAARPA